MQARADMDSIAERLEEQYPEGSANLKISVVPLREQYTGSAKPILRVLAGVVGILLLISCVNIAQLLLARATGRRKEIALRAALGAGRGRVLRQLLTESLVLGLAGAILGAALSTVAFTFLARLIPDNFPQGTTLALDPVVLLFAATVGVLTSVAFGLGPSLAASRFNLNDALKQSKLFGPGWRRRKIRSALVVVEVSMSAVLLVAATLLLRSYHQLSSVELGLSTEGLWIIETPLSTSRYRDSQRRSELASGVIERISALSGVVSAGYVNYAPLVFKGGRAGFLIEGRPMPAPNQFPQQIVSDRVV